jgi:hypothetical protein
MAEQTESIGIDEEDEEDDDYDYGSHVYFFDHFHIICKFLDFLGHK